MASGCICELGSTNCDSSFLTLHLDFSFDNSVWFKATKKKDTASSSSKYDVIPPRTRHNGSDMIFFRDGGVRQKINTQIFFLLNFQSVTLLRD